MLLRRLCFPSRLADLVQMFGLRISQLSLLINWALNFVYARSSLLMNNLEIWRDSVDVFLGALARRGVSNQLGCCGFLDCTLRPTTRPQFGQRAIFSGHRRVHGIKFEMVSLPSGMIAWLHGPYDGRRHDSFILHSSGLLQRLVDFSNSMQNNICVYADAAYPISEVLQVGFKGSNLSVEQQNFNAIMSAVRESVEWTFGKIIQYFAFVDFKKNLKIFLLPAAKYYFVSAFLTNCHTCCYGSVTSAFFDCAPPELETYLNMHTQA